MEPTLVSSGPYSAHTAASLHAVCENASEKDYLLEGDVRSLGLLNRLHCKLASRHCFL